MSFRTRLTWFFVLIVVVPLVAVAAMLVRLVADAERGKTDARLRQAERTASAIHEQARTRAVRAARSVAGSPRLARALRERDARRSSRAVESLLRSTPAARAVVRLTNGRVFAVGGRPAVAPAAVELTSPEGTPVGTLRLSVLSAERLARRLADHTRLEVVVSEGSGTLGSTLSGVRAATLPQRGEVELGERDLRVTSFTAPGFEPGERVTVRLLADERDTLSAVTRDSILVALALAGFLLIACGFAYSASRSLQAQVGRLLEGARRLGAGELSVEVPTEGDDEFAALGNEFNSMARQLERRLEELQLERSRLQRAFRRVGESFAGGLDRDAILRTVLHTAMDGVGADGGRASFRADGGPLRERARAGDLADLEEPLLAAEAAVLDAAGPVEESQGAVRALAHPLVARGRPQEVIGIVSVGRRGRPFSGAEKDLFHYLASQVAVSIENVDLHETVQRQAVTDELTGLFNHRRFQEVVAAEVERAKRFGSSLGLVMLDLDDFKSINDTFGHLQGDLVLREVAAVLRETCREVDEPARYGGEEMAVALPGTDLEGAVRFAERVRARIEALDVPVAGSPEAAPVRVTASFGAAALPESASLDKDALVAAADAALYRAKRGGRNRVVEAR